MKISLIIVAVWCGMSCGSLAGQVQAQLLPDTPNAPVTSTPDRASTPRAFWELSSAYAGLVVADAWTTQRNLNAGCYEKHSWLYGRHPSAGRFMATDAALWAVEVWAGRRIVRMRERSGGRGRGGSGIRVRILHAAVYGVLGREMEDRAVAIVGNVRARCYEVAK